MRILSIIQMILSIALLAEVCWYWHFLDKKTKEINILLEMHKEFEKFLKEKRKNEND